ncbi:MAG: hypothetical protein JWO82_1159, partial [Akkermansiaceae bacterium]|nr:hypothetical protein [Akkermansiaceae bacterium]
EKVPAMLEQARQICDSFLACGENYAPQSGPGLAIMAHAAGNAGAALDAWHDQLAPELKKAYDYARGRYGLPNNLRVTRSSPLQSPAMTPQRREILKRFLCDAPTVARELRTPSEIIYLLDFEVFDKDDLFAVLDELPKDHPLRVKFFAEKAAILSNRFHDPEEARRGYDAALAMAKDSGNVRDLPYVIASKAKSLADDLHRPDEAAVLLKDIDLSLLDEREKDWVTEFQAKQKH